MSADIHPASQATVDTASTAPQRLSVNMNSRTADDLRTLAKNRGITYTEAVRRAVEVLAFLEKERELGHAIQVVDSDNKTREIITL